MNVESSSQLEHLVNFTVNRNVVVRDVLLGVSESLSDHSSDLSSGDVFVSGQSLGREGSSRSS